MHRYAPRQWRSQAPANVPNCLADIPAVQRATRAAYRSREDVAHAEATLADALDTLALARRMEAEVALLLVGSVAVAVAPKARGADRVAGDHPAVS